MKTALILTLVLIVTAVCVYATSPPSCWCAPDTCHSVAHCPCGTHKDYCDCCDQCNACPGDECTKISKEPCSEGHLCVPDNPELGFENGGKGHCKPLNDTTTEHHA
ncbi:8.6 kDa transglutaminase substrate-like [Amblyomma americanum]